MKKINYRTLAKRYLTIVKKQTFIKGAFIDGNYAYVMDGCSYMRYPADVYEEIFAPFELSTPDILKKLVRDSASVNAKPFYHVVGNIDKDKFLLQDGANFKIIAAKYLKPFLAYDEIKYVEVSLPYGTGKQDTTRTPLIVMDSESNIIGYILPISAGRYDTLENLTKQVKEYEEG